jgi:hypothetical protein
VGNGSDSLQKRPRPEPTAAAHRRSWTPELIAALVETGAVDSRAVRVRPERAATGACFEPAAAGSIGNRISLAGLDDPALYHLASADQRS